MHLRIGIVLALTLSGPLLAADLENKYLRLTCDADRPALPLQLQHRQAHAVLSLATVAPDFEFEGGSIGGTLEPSRLEVHQEGNGARLVLEYPPQRFRECELDIRVVFTIPHDLPIVRKQAELSVRGPAHAELMLKHVLLLDEPFEEHITYQMAGWQSYPVFGERFFFGIEFPVAQAAAAEGRVRLRHAPGRVIRPPEVYQSHHAVIGVCPEGRVRETFENHISSFRPIADQVHFNYNSWWTSPVPFSESDIVTLIETFDEKLYQAHGVSFDSFTLDMGWSSRHGIWVINDRLFPKGFSLLNARLARQQAQLGLWWSPSNHYSPASFDNTWAADQGYETISVPRANLPPAVFTCLARGTRYQRETARNLAGIARDSRLGQMKFDGYRPECPVDAHGHQPGELSREAIALGLIDVLNALREVNPNLWMETTCFGYDASPWWLQYATSVIGPYGDDAPYGAVPAPVYRESYTTSRDFFNLHGSVTPVPIAAQEVLGIIHQTAEPMYNDAVTAVMRGHQFISLYLNPRYMGAQDYAFLADLMRWTRANAALLARTKVIWPATWKKQGPAPFHDLKNMPRESYGYAHWREGQGLLCVRNPWIAMEEVEIALDEATFGMPADEPGTFAALEIYPTRRCLAKGLQVGGTLPLRMAPYEARVIQFVPDSEQVRIGPDPRDEVLESAKVGRSSTGRLEITTQSPNISPLGDGYTVVSRPVVVHWQSQIEGTSKSADWQLYWLVESLPPGNVSGEVDILINGRPTVPQIIDSQTGWTASQPSLKQNTWRWYTVPLPKGAWKARASIETPGPEVRVSAWLLYGADAPGNGDPSVEAAVPSPHLPLAPDRRIWASHQVIAPQPVTGLPMRRETRSARIERINGIYLDRLEPVSSTQGWGVLRRNQSVWDRPLHIGDRRFARGLGTHAPSRIVYRLDGRYGTLHGYAGQNAAVNGTISMEIHLDGVKVWESGRLTREDQAKPFSIPLGRATELTLIVTDGGDTLHGDHADWADVWLERN